MKKLRLKHPDYLTYVESYREWLNILGYAANSVYYLPLHLQEFLYYLEKKDCFDLQQVSKTKIDQYYAYLKLRSNEKRGGALSNAYLNKHQYALQLFTKYLQFYHQKSLPLQLQREVNQRQKEILVLTQREVKQLFTACSYSHHKPEYRLRDKAILVLLYSCGLRRREAEHIDVKDMLYDRGLLHVRKAKNYRERLVPINRYNLNIVQEYREYARDFFVRDQKDALLITMFGQRLCGQTLVNRLKAIVKATGNSELMDKEITPHTLRHSIATHLLQKGAPLQSIQAFLGHRSLESTQIYTHLLKHQHYERL